MTTQSFTFTAADDDDADGIETVTLGFGSELPAFVDVGSPSTATISIAEDDASAATDRAVLEALYNATGGPSWTNAANWLSNEPLGDWHGVDTDSEGRVVALDLSLNGLTGGLPQVLGNLDRLTSLRLSQNGLTGQIPVTLGKLTGLTELYLDGNRLSGPIPPALVAGLTSLTHLSLGDNSLGGTIPAALGNAVNLEVLNLRSNGLSGPIPVELGELLQLRELYLDDNRLTGSIPVELALVRLEKLWLSDNALSGPIPEASLAALFPSILSELALWSNPQLTGSIPDKLGYSADRAALVALYDKTDGPNWTTNTNWPGDQPVSDWFGVTTDTVTSRVTHVDLSGNGLTGPTPGSLEALTALVELKLADNRALTGTLPVRLGELADLAVVHIQDTGACAPAALRTWTTTIDFMGCVRSSGGGGGGGSSRPTVTVSFAQPAYAAVEGGSAAVVAVVLNVAPRRTVSIPLTMTPGDGTTADDYAVEPASVVFDRTAAQATVAVTAVADMEADDAETLTLGFGTLPSRVRAGDLSTATVTLHDPAVAVSFGRPAYTAGEGGPGVPITVRLSAAPNRTVTVPLTAGHGAGATADDYAGVPPTVTFGNDETVQVITVTATEDAADDDDETIVVGFDNDGLPAQVTAGRPATATITIADADGPDFADGLQTRHAVRAVHIMELRMRIDALRAGYGLSAFTWTDAVIESGVTPIRAAHITELRSALDDAYDGAAQSRPVYTDDSIVGGVTPIVAAHFTELRAAIAALEGATAGSR